MDYPYKEEKRQENGVPSPFHCHMQYQFGAGDMVDAHFHDYIEILYCLEGDIKVFLDGISYSFTVGDMILINSKEIHHVFADSTENRYIVVKFEPEVLYATTQTIFEAKYLMPFTSNKSSHQKLFPKKDIHNTFIPSCLMDILKEYNEKEYGFELAIRSHICRIFLFILRNWNRHGANLTVNEQLDETTMSWLEKVFDYVSTHYHNQVSVLDAAELSNMSYHYFSRKFKRIMKKSFSEYLNFVRISEAEKLLMTTDLNITEIALEVGFSTSSYFIQQFKMYKSISPKRFRSNLNALNK